MLQNWNGTTFDHVCPIDGHVDSGLTVISGIVLRSLLDGTGPDQSAFAVQCSADGTLEWFDTGVTAIDTTTGDFRAGQATIIRGIMGVLGWTENSAGHGT